MNRFGHALIRRALPSQASVCAIRAFGSDAPHLVSTSEAVNLIGKPDVTFVDIRDPRMYSKGHISNAVNMVEFFSYLALTTPQGVDHLTRTFEKLLQAKGITGNERLICYEDSLRGMYGASCRGWYLLRTLSHPNVQVLDGGWQKWLREKRPVETGVEVPRSPSNFTVKFDDTQWTNLEAVRAILDGTSNAKLLDVRDKVEWDGHSSSPYGVDFAPRKGRLPTATHIEWYDFMEKVPEDVENQGADDDSDDDEKLEDVVTFKKPDEIRRMMSNKGFKQDDQIVIYCFKGARASNTLSALKLAGFSNVSNYFGSWNEWSREENLTIDATKF